MTPYLLLATLNMPSAQAARIQTAIVGVDAVSLGLNGAQFTVIAEVTRSGGLPASVRGVRYEIFLHGERIGVGETHERVRLRNKTPAEVRIPTTLYAVRGIMALSQLSNPAAVELRIVGEADARGWFWRRTQRFDERISLDAVLSRR